MEVRLWKTIKLNVMEKREEAVNRRTASPVTSGGNHYTSSRRAGKQISLYRNITRLLASLTFIKSSHRIKPDRTLYCSRSGSSGGYLVTINTHCGLVGRLRHRFIDPPLFDGTERGDSRHRANSGSLPVLAVIGGIFIHLKTLWSLTIELNEV
ncbi:hypothetical protein J6590_021098 [Homalodisca vitripennis]|nr:hypothetical protein J6590_021098 [Homalodisca vitripennis]